MTKYINLSFILIIAVFLLLSTILLLDDPLVWPDEAIYGDISRNLMLENRLGTDLWKGFIEGIENHFYSLPPLYLYTSSIWYKAFGFSIITQRLFSIFLGALSLVIFYLVSRKFILSGSRRLKSFLPLGLTILLAIDTVFLKASRLGRPEIFVLLLVVCSILFYLKSTEEKIDNSRQKYLFLTGLFLGLSIITHLIAVGFALAVIFAFIYAQRKNLFDFKKYYFLALGILIPVTIWLIYLYPNYQYLIDQLKLVEASRHYTIPWYDSVLNFPLLKLSYSCYILICFLFVGFTIKSRKQPFILLSLLIVFSWIFTTLGRIYWYTVYPVTLSYLALLILINQAFNLRGKKLQNSLFKLTLIAVCLVLLSANLIDFSNSIKTYYMKDYYPAFQNQIAKSIPAGKTVFLSSIPDAYYGFERGRNRLLEFPALFEGMDKFKKTLREADYIVFNDIFIPDPQALLYLDQYIAKNLETAHELTFPYHILIFKIKDKDLRSDVY